MIEALILVGGLFCLGVAIISATNWALDWLDGDESDNEYYYNGIYFYRRRK